MSSISSTTVSERHGIAMHKPCTIEIKNIGSDRAYVGSSDFSMMDSEGFKYDPELYYGNDGFEMIKELYQNQKVRGKVLFEVPEDAKGLKIQYDFGSLFAGVKLASWELE